MNLVVLKRTICVNFFTLMNNFALMFIDKFYDEQNR